MATARLLGAVLAGGRSRRYGGDKSNALVGGRPLIERAIAALEQVVQDVVVVTSRQLPDGVVTPSIPDRFVDAGPLGGLHAALHTAVEYGSSGVLLLACDMPLLRKFCVLSQSRWTRDPQLPRYATQVLSHFVLHIT